MGKHGRYSAGKIAFFAYDCDGLYKLLKVVNWENWNFNPIQVFDVKTSAKQKFSAWTVHQKIQKKGGN